jgi:hypothetical protein
MTSSISFPEKVTAGMRIPWKDRVTIERRYRIIEPLLYPEQFTEIWRENGNLSGRTAHKLAMASGYSVRTIFNWRDRFRSGGTLALARSKHARRNCPKLLKFPKKAAVRKGID